MKEYIDKSALVAEIERRTKAYQENFDKADNKIAKLFADGLIQGLESFLAFLDTFEVKEVKEEPVSKDLEREIKHYVYDPYFDLNGVAVKGATDYLTVEDVADIARHFAQWQKEQLIEKACVFLKSTDFYKYYNREFVKEFVKAMEK